MSLNSEHYLKKLDFDLVKNKIAELTSFYISKEISLSFNPSSEFKVINHLQLETYQCREILNKAGYINCSGVDDSLSVILDRIAKNGVLSGSEILIVKNLLVILSDFKKLFINQNNKFLILENIANKAPDLDYILVKVNEVIGDNGFVLDGPNNNLNNIRRRISDSYKKVVTGLDSIISSNLGKEIIQDPVVLVRGDRLVLSIKSGMSYKLPGILHGSSKSGATQFVEPFESVENCNIWRGYLEEENREINRILLDISNLIYDNLDNINKAINIIGKYDFIQARALYSESISGIIVETLEDWGEASYPQDDLLKIINARHPLLKESVVPLNIDLKKDTKVLLISGPNAGGKTIALKTIGLLVLMNQYGINIPVDEGSILPYFKSILVDLGDDQGIESSMSTYSAHLESISTIFKQAKSKSLVLLDEIGSNTDPEEGSALAKAILKNLSLKKMLTVATSHHRSVMIYGENESNVINASVQFDEITMRPTYKLKQGEIGQSNAIDLAIKKGFPRRVIQNAKEFLTSQDEELKIYSKNIIDLKQSYEKDISEISKTKKKINLIKDEINEQLSYLISNRNQMINSIRNELIDHKKKAIKKIKDLESELKTILEKKESIIPKQSLNKIKTEVLSHNFDEFDPAKHTNREKIKIGDLVELGDLKLVGSVISDIDQNGDLDINVNGVRMKVNISRAKKVHSKKTFSSSINYDFSPKLHDYVLDIRGQNVENALLQVNNFLDLAVRDGFEFIKVIHGTGSGALKNSIREEFLKNPLVKSVEPNLDNHNADVATLIYLS